MAAGNAGGRLAAVVQRRGAPVMLVAITRSSGPAPLVNPPDVDAATLAADGATAIGATVLSLRSSLARGQLLPGDRLFFGPGGGLGMTTVTATASSRPSAAVPDGFTGVQVLALPFAVPDGTPVTVLCKASIGTFAIVGSFPQRLIDGTRIQASDLSIVVSAHGIPEPQTAWRVVFSGRSYSIVSVVPAFERGVVVSYTLQAR